MVMLEQAFLKYTAAVQAKFEASRCAPTRKGGLVEWLNEDDLLRSLVNQLEDGPEFSVLQEATHSKFRSYDWHSARDESSWRDPIRNFFRRTGYYTDSFFSKSDGSCELFQRYEKAFQRRSAHTTYLAPMEFVKFPKPELKFSGFEIRRFDKEDLEQLVGNEVNRVFYPHAFLDKVTLDALEEYWFIVAMIEETPRRLGHIYFSAAVVAATKGHVYQEYTRFPPAIERVLARLVLFDWVGDPQDHLAFCGQDGLPFSFEVPFALRVDDNDLQRPKSVPDCSTLKSYGIRHVDPETEEEYKGHFVIFDLDESRAAAFEQCINRADQCLMHLEKKKHDTEIPYLETLDTRWPFLKIAMGNLIKAFFANEDFEQLLWHVTALEALLGDRGPSLTTSLARRSAAILGRTENERKTWKKKFAGNNDNGIYDLRSALVHGRKIKKETSRKQLFEARMMVLRVMVWFVHYLSEIAASINEGSWQSDVPKREDFLVLLDLSGADRVRLKALLKNLPHGFPSAPNWSLVKSET